jgi:putative hemolysin
MPADELAILIGLDLPARRLYHTVAGLVLEKLGRLPKAGESFTFSGWRFEVVDMDGRRVDKVLIARPTLNTHRKLS